MRTGRPKRRFRNADSVMMNGTPADGQVTEIHLEERAARSSARPSQEDQIPGNSTRQSISARSVSLMPADSRDRSLGIGRKSRNAVWCQKRIEENRRGIAVFVRAEEEFYERDLGRTKRSMGREKVTGAGALPLPFQFLAAWVGVWVARHQTDQVEYLKAVNRALMDRVGKKRLRFTDAERRKLAVLGKGLGPRRTAARKAFLRDGTPRESGGPHRASRRSGSPDDRHRDRPRR